MNTSNSSASLFSAKIGQNLHQNTWVKVAEILGLFLLAFLILGIGSPYVAENPFYTQILVWFANVAMIIYVWMGLRLRGENWKAFGFSFTWPGWKEALKIFGLSLLVFIITTAVFVLVGGFLSSMGDEIEKADMSSYNYLAGNLPLTILALLGVFIVSSFGEEVIYRAFLMNRIGELGNNKKWAWFLAVLLSSIIFGLVHASWGWMGMVQTAFMGLSLALFYLFLGRKLWINIIAHVYMDAILIIQMYMPAQDMGVV